MAKNVYLHRWDYNWGYKINKEMELYNEPYLRLATVCPEKGLSRGESHRLIAGAGDLI